MGTTQNGLIPSFGTPLIITRRNFHDATVWRDNVITGPYSSMDGFDFVVPRLTGGKISLEGFDVGAGFGPVTGATERHAFARALNGQSLKVFVR